MIFIIHPDNPDSRKINLVIDILNKGGIIIYPTDTVYALACSLNHKKSIAKLAQIKQLKLKKAQFSIVFNNLSKLVDYTKHIDRPTYKLLRKNLPGPFTFILNASNQVPKLFDTNKKTIGIRIPDNKIVHAIVEALDYPLVTTSLHDDDDILEYTTDPYLIEEKWAKIVDGIIDGGYGKNEPSTVVDLSDGEPEIIRQGIGILEG